MRPGDEGGGGGYDNSSAAVLAADENLVARCRSAAVRQLSGLLPDLAR